MQRILTFTKWVLTFGLIAVFLEILLEVSFRYILHKPLPWGGEVSRTLLVWMTFLGSALALFRGEHMAVNIVVNKISNRKGQMLFKVIGKLGVLAFLIIAFYSGVQVTVRTWGMLTTALQIPAGVLYLAFPLGCALMIPAVLMELSSTIRKE